MAQREGMKNGTSGRFGHRPRTITAEYWIRSAHLHRPPSPNDRQNTEDPLLFWLCVIAVVALLFAGVFYVRRGNPGVRSSDPQSHQGREGGGPATTPYPPSPGHH